MKSTQPNLVLNDIEPVAIDYTPRHPRIYARSFSQMNNLTQSVLLESDLDYNVNTGKLQNDWNTDETQSHIPPLSEPSPSIPSLRRSQSLGRKKLPIILHDKIVSRGAQARRLSPILSTGVHTSSVQIKSAAVDTIAKRTIEISGVMPIKNAISLGVLAPGSSPIEPGMIQMMRRKPAAPGSSPIEPGMIQMMRRKPAAPGSSPIEPGMIQMMRRKPAAPESSSVEAPTDRITGRECQNWAQRWLKLSKYTTPQVFVAPVLLRGNAMTNLMQEDLPCNRSSRQMVSPHKDILTKLFIRVNGHITQSNRRKHGGFIGPNMHRVLASRYFWRSCVVQNYRDANLLLDVFGDGLDKANDHSADPFVGSQGHVTIK
jgi:hypothetical protein